MKNRLLRKNTVELVWWLFALACGSITFSQASAEEWWWFVLGLGVMVLSFFRIEDHWRKL